MVETDVYATKKVSFVLLFLANLSSIAGFLNTLVLLQDIAVIRSYRLTIVGWWINYVNTYEELYPHLSRNKAINERTESLIDNEVAKEQKDQKQPSFGEKFRYNLLVSVFRKPKQSDVNLDFDPYYGIGDEEATLSIKEKNVGVEDEDEDEIEFNKNVLNKL
jgi:hypothetical protein